MRKYLLLFLALIAFAFTSCDFSSVLQGLGKTGVNVFAGGNSKDSASVKEAESKVQGVIDSLKSKNGDIQTALDGIRDLVNGCNKHDGGRWVIDSDDPDNPGLKQCMSKIVGAIAIDDYDDMMLNLVKNGTDDAKRIAFVNTINDIPIEGTGVDTLYTTIMDELENVVMNMNVGTDGMVDDDGNEVDPNPYVMWFSENKKGVDLTNVFDVGGDYKPKTSDVIVLSMFSKTMEGFCNLEDTGSIEDTIKEGTDFVGDVIDLYSITNILRDPEEKPGESKGIFALVDVLMDTVKSFTGGNKQGELR